MNRFTTIFWDVDDTLLDFAYSQRHALSECFRSIGREMTEAELALYTQINDDYWKRLELGEVTKEQLLTGRFLLLFEKLGIEGVDVEGFRAGYQAGLGSTFSFLESAGKSEAVRHHQRCHLHPEEQAEAVGAVGGHGRCLHLRGDRKP